MTSQKAVPKKHRIKKQLQFETWKNQLAKNEDLWAGGPPTADQQVQPILDTAWCSKSGQKNCSQKFATRKRLTVQRETHKATLITDYYSVRRPSRTASPLWNTSPQRGKILYIRLLPS